MATMFRRTLKSNFLVLAATLSLVSASGHSLDRVETQELEDKDIPKANESRSHSLAVKVVSMDQSTESPVAAASVKIWVDEQTQEKKTGSDGAVSFTFTSKATIVTVRVTGDQMHPDQQQLPLGTPKINHRVVLTKSD